ncbi:2'-5'-oligoadenylate synthase-like protein 2 [Notamacropus eugenii]|uniref:2'-5'-oligoadenylate synthase-like protein 2 n=1 Tax=Notamacropus eugenii TaxID=9315 RepID=UPI003B66E8A1
METCKDLYTTSAEELDVFVAHMLQPDKEWKDEVKDVFERTAGFFREQCFQDYTMRGKKVKVIKVLKGGSCSKGVDLKHTSDVDVLVFLSCFSSYEDQYKLRDPIIEFMMEKLEKCQKSLAYDITNISKQESSKKSVPPRSFNFTVQSRKWKKPIHLDVLPVFNALGEENPPLRQENYPALNPRLTVQQEVYEKLLKSGRRHGEFTPSFSELQRSFVKHRPTKLKSLLRLVKYWYREYVKNKYPGKRCPPKYALELLTIYAWETGTQKAEDFSLAKGFVTVMKLLMYYRRICICWTDYYNFENHVVGHFVKRQLTTGRKKRPVILDPADPTNKVGYKCEWYMVAKEASYCLRQTCSQMKDGRHISSWRKKGARNIWVILTYPGLWELKFYVNAYDPIQQMKKEIERVKKIPIADQRLSFEEPRRKPKVLMGHKNLAKYRVSYQIQIQVLDINSARCKIHVKFPDDTYHTYPYESKDTILMVKQQIEDHKGLPVMGQLLRFQGQLLSEGKNLKDYGIKDGDTLEFQLTRKQKRKSEKKKKKEVLVRA